MNNIISFIGNENTAMHHGNKSFEMFSQYPDILTIEDIQSALGIGRSLAYRLINDGSIRNIRIGRNVKVPKQFLVDYVLRSCYNGAVATGNLSCQKGGF